ncbi:carbon-phosphorus lyase complex subunit PhnI [Dendrosporobacter sp. 1207_IL3150]|uniref:carbon-phosphorus lyase complex subunit PhnI n=1 Tax=Dendrosporobacter sp. 1207_IL3150 TaxID=3084054 RepID=UPI002FD93857
MGYVAVKGGTLAIDESIKRLKFERLKNQTVLNVKDIEGGMRGLIDTVMSESSLYNRESAAIAIKQAEGSVEEAVFLLRAYRSTLPRKHYSNTIDTQNMHVERRISSCFKDIQGGQILGAAYDYTHRLIDFSLDDEYLDDVKAWLTEFEARQGGVEQSDICLNQLPKVTEYLRQEGLISSYEDDDNEPVDITKKNLEFPTVRSERLQMLSRGQTGAVTSLGYAALRGYGDLHPTVGELRVGNVEVYIDNPLGDGNYHDCFYLGQLQITEVETYVARSTNNNTDNSQLQLEIGYGACFGQNETKSIAMSMLDLCLETDNPKYPTQDEEFVLFHIDSVESTGFISHLKLPHYVTFKSKLDSVRKTRDKEGAGNED